MPKIPAKKFYIIAFLLILLLGITAAFYLYQNGSLSHPKEKELTTFPGASPQDPNPESSSQKKGFYGSVTAVDPVTKTLAVKNSEDGVTYTLKLNSKGVVTRAGKTSDFSKIQIKDNVNVYSNDIEKLDESSTLSIDLINISVPLDPNTLEPTQ